MRVAGKFAENGSQDSRLFTRVALPVVAGSHDCADIQTLIRSILEEAKQAEEAAKQP